MPRRVYIVHWVVGGVGVQVLCPRAVYVSLERILLQEPPRVRVVVPAPQVVRPAVIQRRTGKLDVVLYARHRFLHARFFVPERIIDVFLRTVQCSVLHPYQVGRAPLRIVMVDPVCAPFDLLSVLRFSPRC